MKDLRGTLIFTGAVLINSAWVFYFYLSTTHIGTFQPALLSKALIGTAERPYVYRVLIPLLAKIFSPLVPDGFLDWVAGLPNPFKYTFDALSSGGYFHEAALVMLLMFLSLVGFAYAERKLIETLGAQPEEKFTFPIIAQILILPFSLLFGFYYDLPQIFLVTLSLVFMLQARWGKYLITLALASFNKETSLFLIFVFLLYYLQRLPSRRFLELLAVQLGLYTLIRISLLTLYRTNPGAPVYITWRNHYEQYYSYPSTLVFTLIFFFVIGFLVLRGWKSKHPFIRATAAIPLITLVMFFNSGMPMEFRVFLDALPALAVLLLPSHGVLLANPQTERL